MSFCLELSLLLTISLLTSFKSSPFLSENQLTWTYFFFLIGIFTAFLVFYINWWSSSWFYFVFMKGENWSLAKPFFARQFSPTRWPLTNVFYVDMVKFCSGSNVNLRKNYPCGFTLIYCKDGVPNWVVEHLYFVLIFMSL